MMLRRAIWQPVAEITVIGAWAAWLGRSYLDMNPYTWPVGGEWGTQLQTHHLWTQLQRCGLCALWNGGINGGAPAFADLFGSMLHPLVMITTLLWGVVVGAKVAVVVALGLTGIAQWWIARVLRVELIARLWSSLLAVAGGHLAGRLENGNFGLVLSTAACSLALAAAFNLGITRERHATLALAVMGASALLAGQGYLQLALLGWSPAFLVLMIDARWRWSDIWREYLLAIGLALLLAGIFLIPLFHFWPQVAKGSDPTFRAAQPLAFIPLNLVIVEYSSRTQALGMLPFTYLYNLYIGWIPVILAILAVVGIRRHATRGLLFLSSGTFLMFFLASAIPLRWLGHFLPSVANIRHTPLLAGLAVPALLGLAAIEVDHLHSRPQLRWLLSIPLLWSLWAPAVQTQRWLRTTDASSLYSAIANLRTQNLAWVAPPYGELRWTQAGLDLGLKMSPIVWVFTWQNVPMPYLEAVPNSSPPALLRIGQWAGLPLLSLGAAGVEAERTGTLGKVPIYRYPRQHYAAVVTGSRIYPCQAFGRGGDLTVTCANEQAGELIVQEHTWSGWSAWRNGMPVPLKPDAWLRVAAPAGPHTYAFRYRPWDVLVGLGVTILGTLLTLGLWIHSRATRMTAHRSP